MIAEHELAALCDRDPRIARSLPTPGCITRLRRWLDAGEPDPDLRRLLFLGDDVTRDVVCHVIRTVPAPVGWHAVEFVQWFEVGRSGAGWQAIARPPRCPAGDQQHVIALSGAGCGGGAYPLLCAHELGHSWSALVHATPISVTMSDRESIARQIVMARDADISVDELTLQRVDNEVIADNLAELWLGGTRNTSEARLGRIISDEYQDATELADAIAEKKR